MREDISRPGVLLGLISNNLVEILPRGNATYTISLYANITGFLSSDFVPLSKLRSFYQLEDEILLVDGGLKCIHSLSKDKSEVTTHSGNCTNGDETYISFVQDLNAIQSPLYARDVSFSIATYAKPRELASPCVNTSLIYLTDEFTVRQLDLSLRTVKTIFNSFPSSFTTYDHISFSTRSVVLSGSNKIRVLYSNFTTKTEFKFSGENTSQQSIRKKRQVSQKYGCKSLVPIGNEYILAVRTHCFLFACEETSRFLARDLVLIDLETSDMIALCNGIETQSFCDELAINPYFITGVNSTVFVITNKRKNIDSKLYTFEILGKSSPNYSIKCDYYTYCF